MTVIDFVIADQVVVTLATLWLLTHHKVEPSNHEDRLKKLEMMMNAVTLERGIKQLR